jgi:hypothetical protein
MRALAEPSFNHATRTFCTAIYLHFNYKIYNDGHGLVAWPSWETLMANFGLSEGSIREAIAQTQRHGFLRVERGRHDGRRRAVNKYYALEQPANSAGWKGNGQPANPAGNQPANSEGEQPAGFAVDSMSLDSMNKSLDSMNKNIDSMNRTQPANSDSGTKSRLGDRTPEEETKPAKKYDATPQLVAVVARWRTDATNGSGE